MQLHHLEYFFFPKFYFWGNLLGCRKQHYLYSYLEFFDARIYADGRHSIFSIWSGVSYNFYYLFQS